MARRKSIPGDDIEVGEAGAEEEVATQKYRVVTDRAIIDTVMYAAGAVVELPVDRAAALRDGGVGLTDVQEGDE